MSVHRVVALVWLTGFLIAYPVTRRAALLFVDAECRRLGTRPSRRLRRGARWVGTGWALAWPVLLLASDRRPRTRPGPPRSCRCEDCRTYPPREWAEPIPEETAVIPVVVYHPGGAPW